jgi:nitroreductase
VELEYSTCWIGAFDEIAIKKLLQIPEIKKIVVCMTFGKPRGRHVSRNGKDTESFIYLDRFGNHWNTK